MSNSFLPIQFNYGILTLIDQRKLPLEEVFIDYKTIEGGHEGIRDMVVRGAPCIGFTAIFSMALWLKGNNDCSDIELLKAADYLKTARPTAVNLQYEVDRVVELVRGCRISGKDPYKEVINFGNSEIIESEHKNRKMAEFAQKELESRLDKTIYKLLTHCNTGFLACGSIGTALGVVQHLAEQKKIERVWVDETRPYLQGSRLTAYELVKLGVEHKIVVEGAASFLMKGGHVDAIFTGADRIVENGDTANKVGTSNLSIIAKHYNIPFYIVAPSSSFDLSIKSGNDIEIEMRAEQEILEYNGSRIAPVESSAFNPSFDITDGTLITGIISEKGIATGNYSESLKDII
jgi:methylthioribose-1-phosphate isomerase